MRFVINRTDLVKHVNYAGMFLIHHAQNAAKAKVYAAIGNRINARWYGRYAREDLALYLRLIDHQP